MKKKRNEKRNQNVPKAEVVEVDGVVGDKVVGRKRMLSIRVVNQMTQQGLLLEKLLQVMSHHRLQY